jgi:hypothetical protein
MNLYYSLAEALSECPMRGQLMKARRLPPPSTLVAVKQLKGHTLDRVIGIAYRDLWWEPGQKPKDLRHVCEEAFLWSWSNERPAMLTDAQRTEIIDSVFEGAKTLLEQMRDFDLIPVLDGRVQARVERPYNDDVTITGVIDLLIDSGKDISLVDAKSGTYRSPRQLSWYRYLVEPYRVVPTRVGFWFPLAGVIEWADQKKLPDVQPMIAKSLELLASGDRTTTPGKHCGTCPLFSGCETGIQWKHAITASEEKISVADPGAHMVGF